jgi:hypothetical protein
VADDMTARTGRLLARLAAGVAQPLLAWALLAPVAARASCGEYVVMGPHHTTLAAPEPNLHPEPGGSAPGPAPCSGPTCSRGRPLPVLPLLPAPDSTEHWAWLLVELAVTGPDPRSSLPDGGGWRRVSRGARVYHPPRSPSVRFSA